MMRDEGGDNGSSCGVRWSTTFVVFLDTINRNGDSFLVALGMDLSG